MTTEITIALQLLLAHVVTDFLLQSKKWIKQKRKQKTKSAFLYIHALTAGVLTYVFIQDWSGWQIPLCIAVTHFFIDVWKLNQPKNSLKYFLWDQLFHLLVLLGAWLYLTNSADLVLPFLSSFFTSEKALVLITGYLVVIFPIGFIIGMATQHWQDEISKEDDATSLKKAGRYIGIFERILVLTFILTNNFSAIGFLIAAKSILRFSDKSKSGARKQTEYVLIGTLMSFALTIIIGILMRVLVF
jgi:hypothetical protein